MGADGLPHQVNEKLVKASAGGEYTATLPAMSTMKPVPLLKCVLIALDCDEHHEARAAAQVRPDCS